MILIEQEKDIYTFSTAFPSGSSKKVWENWKEMNRSLEEMAFFDAVDELNALLIQESCFLEGLESQIKWVTSHFTAIQRLLGEKDAGQTRARMNGILKSVTDAAIEAKFVIDDLIFRTARKKKRGTLNKFIFFFNDLIARQKAIKKLELIDIKIADLLGQAPDSSVPWSCPDSPKTIIGDDEAVGRDEDFLKILSNLHLSEETRVQVITIMGMPGIGKSKIAKEIHSLYAIGFHYDFITWVYSGDSQMSQIKQSWENNNNQINNALYQTSPPFQKRKTPLSLDTVHDDCIPKIYDFMSKKRYLIVIDDVATLEAWYDLRRALPMDTRNGSRILLTTRDAAVALQVIEDQPESPSPYHLGPLNDVGSWKLFTMKVHPSPLPPNLVSIGKEIVKKCHGIPLAIKQLAYHLSKEDTEYGEWCKLLESSNKPLDDEHQTPWSYTIGLMAKDIPLKLKQCLLYFGFFPKNAAISVRRLIALWVAEGFVELKENETLEYTAEKYLQQLINLGMVQVAKERSNGRPKRCCLNNYMNEHLLGRAKLANYASFLTTSRTTKGVRRLAYHHEENRTMASPDSYRLLSSFLSFDYRDGSAPGEQIRNFLYGGINKGCFQFLRVLDLERVYKPGLPREIGRLIHLRYLGLRWTYLDTLPSFIGNLTNLQTLDVKHTYINILPKSIWKMRKLRNLYMNESHLAGFVHRPKDGCLENLHTLCGIFLDEESHVEDGLDRLTKLTRLGIDCHITSRAQQDAMAKWIFKLKELRSLRLRSRDQLGKPSTLRLIHFENHKHLSDLYLYGWLENNLFKVNEFPPNLTELTLSASKLEEDPMPTLEKLSNLSILKLYSGSYIGKHMICSSSGFMRLRVLEIWKLEKLEEWSVEDRAMPILKKLEIRSCKNLKMLPPGLQQLTTLKDLKLTDMPKKFRENVKKDENTDWYKNVGLRFVDWNTQLSNTVGASSVSFSSLSSSSSVGGLLLLLLILQGRLPTSPTKNTKPEGLPPL